MSDWDTVTVLKKRAPKASVMKSEQAVNAARRQGIAVDTQLKCENVDPSRILMLNNAILDFQGELPAINNT